jgi:hypothetical protein
MARLNYNSGLFKGNIEENRFQKFLREDGFLKYFLNNSASFGILKKPSDPNLANFRVESGTNSGTVKIAVESDAIDSNGNLIKKEAQDNIALPSADIWYWMKISYLESPLEQGTISISSNGTITGVGTEFTKIFRGGKYTFSKIKLESSLNTLEYQVVEVIDDTNMLISGASFDAESNIKFSVVGTFTPDAVPTANEKFPFRYDSCTLEFIEEVTLNTAPSKSTNEYYIARVRNSSGNISIEDKRAEFYREKADFKLETLLAEANPLIGVESVKFLDALTPRDKNIVQVAWGFRSDNFTVNSSLNKITLSGGLGGKFKSTSDFTDGDFDGWRIYFEDGSYSIINSSSLSASQINLDLDSLSLEKANSTTELLVVPDVESIVIKLKATGSTTLKEEEFEFPINSKIGIIKATCYDETNSSYELSYRYKKFNIYSIFRLFPNDAVGYYDESSFDEGGFLKTELADRNRKTSSNGLIEVILNASAFINRIKSIDTGDRFGLNRFELDNANPVVEFIVGESFDSELIEGTITLSTNHYLNLSSLNANAGNRFDLIFQADITLNGFTLQLVENFVNTGDIGTVLVDFSASLLSASTAGNLIIRCEFDGTNWVTNTFLSQGEISIPDGSITTVKLANDAVTTAKIADGDVTTAKIENGAVTGVKIASGAVTTSKIVNLNVTTDKIGNGAVTTDKIANLNVTEVKIADGAVTTAKIAGGSVTSVKIGTGAVGSSNIGTGAVTTAKIADGDVERTKIADGHAVKIPSGGGSLYTKIVDIGNWNMDTTPNVVVDVGVTVSNIRGIDVIIRSDTGDVFGYRKLLESGSVYDALGAAGTTLRLNRDLSGAFDSTSYDNPNFNRGYIKVDYIV